MAPGSFGGWHARNTPVCVCANKIDRPRKVSESEGRKWARDRGYDHFQGHVAPIRREHVSGVSESARSGRRCE